MVLRAGSSMDWPSGALAAQQHVPDHMAFERYNCVCCTGAVMNEHALPHSKRKHTARGNNTVWERRKHAARWAIDIGGKIL